MTKSDRKKWWDDHPEVRPDVEERTSAIMCRSLGIFSMADDVPATTSRALAMTDSLSCKLCESGPSDEDGYECASSVQYP